MCAELYDSWLPKGLPAIIPSNLRWPSNLRQFRYANLKHNPRLPLRPLNACFPCSRQWLTTSRVKACKITKQHLWCPTITRVSVPVREVVFVQSLSAVDRILFGTRLCALRVAGDKVWYLHFYNGFMELNVSHTKPPDCQSKWLNYTEQLSSNYSSNLRWF